MFSGSENKKYDTGISWTRQTMENSAMKFRRLFVYGLASNIPTSTSVNIL